MASPKARPAGKLRYECGDRKMGHAMERRGTNRRAVKAGRAVTYVVRLPILLLMTLLALSPAPAGADGDAWKRLGKNGIKTGTIGFGISKLFTITSPSA